MSLWHQKLIPLLPRQQLLGQHRECCALRGKGWGKKHKTVDYVFTHDPEYLVAYHFEVMDEMRKRGYNPDPIWYASNYRGAILGNQVNWANIDKADNIRLEAKFKNQFIYPEHNNEYLQDCLDNLKSKGIEIELGE